METQNIAEMNMADSLYQSILNTIHCLQDEYSKCPTRQKKRELLYHLERQKAYLLLTEEEKESNNKIYLRYSNLSPKGKKSLLLEYLDILENNDGRKVTVKIGNTRKKIAKSVKMEYLYCLSILKSLEELEKTKELEKPKIDDDSLKTKNTVKNKSFKKNVPKIIISIACTTIAAVIAASGIHNIRLDKDRSKCVSRSMKCSQNKHLSKSETPKISEVIEGFIDSMATPLGIDYEIMPLQEQLDRDNIYKEEELDLYSFLNSDSENGYDYMVKSVNDQEIMSLQESLDEDIVYKEAALDLSSYPPLNCDDPNVYYRLARPYKASQAEYELVCRITFREAGGSTEDDRYIDSVGVVTTMLNRLDTPYYIDRYGDSISAQIYGDLQFTTVALLPKTTFEQVPEVTRRAVTDALNGLRNHVYVGFKGENNTDPGRTQIVPGGNKYANVMNSIVEENENQLILLEETGYQYTK